MLQLGCCRACGCVIEPEDAAAQQINGIVPHVHRRAHEGDTDIDTRRFPGTGKASLTPAARCRVRKRAVQDLGGWIDQDVVTDTNSRVPASADVAADDESRETAGRARVSPRETPGTPRARTGTPSGSRPAPRQRGFLDLLDERRHQQGIAEACIRAAVGCSAPASRCAGEPAALAGADRSSAGSIEINYGMPRPCVAG